MTMSSSVQDLAILGLQLSATPADIKAAYRTLAKRWHPDQVQDIDSKKEAEEKFKLISLAYERLKDYDSASERELSNVESENLDQEYRATVQVGRDELLKQHQAEMYYEKGTSYVNQGRYEEAIESYARAIKIQPNYIEAYRARGFARSSLGLERTAASDIRKANALELEKFVSDSKVSSENSSEKQTEPQYSDPDKSSSTQAKRSDSFEKKYQQSTVRTPGNTANNSERTTADSDRSSNTVSSMAEVINLRPIETSWLCDSIWNSDQGRIRSMVASRDGRLLLSVGDSQTIQIRSQKKGAILHELNSFNSIIQKIVLSKDDLILCGYSDQNKIYIWSLSAFWNTGELSLLRTIAYPLKTKITSISLSPDNHVIGIGDESGRISLWRTKDGSRLYVNQDYSSSVLASTFNVSGRAWVTSGESGLIRVRQSDTFQLKQEMTIPDLTVNTMRMSPDGQWMAVGGQQGQVAILPQNGGNFSQVLGRHTRIVQDLVFSPNQQNLISASSSGEVAVWRLRDRTLLSRFSGDSPIVSIAVNKDGNSIYTAHHDGIIRAWKSPLQ
jgi:COMPASS component SWD3